MKQFYYVFLLIMVSCVLSIRSYASVITHNISSSSLNIPGNSTDDYVITGSTGYNYVVVGFGYKGTITLKNCTFNFTSSGSNSPIRITGKNNLSNTDPSRTNVNIVLDGDNVIYVNGGGRAGIQVDQGAQVNISAIESCDDSSGSLTVTQASDEGGAGIGSLNHYNNRGETTSTARLSNGNTGTTAGGNIVISSGTVTTKGGHGAGLGGGYGTWYDGMIVIYGGIVNASTIRHAAGVGSGCPDGYGVENYYTPNSAIIALPPSKITATGAGGTNNVPIPSLALAGTKVLVYIGDPNKPTINVQTIDKLANANVYVDLSQDPDINGVVSTTVNPALLDINQVYFGKTNASGVYSTTGQLQNNTTFFTDATSTNPSTIGHLYLPTVTKLPNGGNVQLEMLQADFRIISYPSVYLKTGYSNQEAVKNAACVKITYHDANPITDLVFDLANGSTSDFDAPIFLASDSSTVISAPTLLNNGDVYYVIVPLKTGKSPDDYSDVLRIIGKWKGLSTSYIRQIISQIVANVRTEFIFEGESYVFNGETLTKEGVYTSVKTNTSTCKTESEVEILNLIVCKRYNLNEKLAIRENDLPYTWRDVIFPKGTKTSVLTYNRKTAKGCDSIVTLNLTVYPNYDLKESLTICANELPYTWRDTTLKVGTSSGKIVFHRKSIYGSDSIVTLNLIVHPSFSIEENLVICDNDLPYKWRDTTFAKGTNSKEISFIRHTTHGCDSIVNLHITVKPSIHKSESLSLCSTELPYNWRDTTFAKGTVSGNFTFARQTFLGCDSVVELNLTVRPSYNHKENVVICANELPYTWRDTTFKAGTASGLYVFHRSTIYGCDSVVTLNLTVHPSFDLNEELVICENELPYKWRDTTFAKGTTTKNVTFFRRTIHGCDSIVKLHLTVNPIIRQKESLFLCTKDFPYNWRDTTFDKGTTTGNFTFKRHSVLGCDSIVELSLTVRPSYNLQESLTICANELPYTWRDINLSKGTTSGKYVFERQTIHGCDSVVTLNLTVHPSYAINEELIICENELPFTWRDTIFGKGTESQNIIFTRRSLYGCDSITNLSLTIYPSKIKTEMVRTCHREKFYFRDRLIEDQGIYDDSLMTSNGCDSIIRLVYVIDPIYAFTKEDTLYEGGVYHWRDRELTAPGVYYDTAHTQSGCDSVFKLTLVSSIGYLFADTVELCNQDEYHWRGKTYTESGLYKDPYKSSMGTDSVYTLLLTLHKKILTHRQIICCPGETFVLRGKEHKISEVFYDTVPSFFGCDSICEYVVTQARDFYKKVELCRKTEGAYHYLGKDYPVPGHYVIEGRTVDGCDSIHELDLRVEKNIVIQDTITLCHTSLPFTYNGKTYTEPGLYHDKTIEEDCGTTTTNHVIRIGNSYHFTTNATACAFEPYMFQGKTYSSSGTYMVPYTSICGCDSIYQLNLTVQIPVNRTRRDSICLGEQYTFHGKTYTAAGTYTDNICYGDSSVVEKLYLSVIQPPRVTHLSTGTSCSDEQALVIEFDYKGHAPDYCYVYMNQDAQRSGFASSYYLPVDGNMVTIPQPAALKPQTYSFRLTPQFAFCDTLPGMNGTFYVRYPSSIIEQNWDDVVAALNYENNGGYHFSYYRWEVNGAPIIGQNSPILYLPNRLKPGDEVVCYLTRTGEQEAIPTCPLSIRTYSDVHAYPIYVSPTLLRRSVPRTKMTTSQKVTYKIVDSFGRIISSDTVSKGEWEICLPEQSGLYILTILPIEGKPITYKIMVM